MRRSLYAALLVLLAGVSGAESHSGVALDSSETLFTVLTAINTCGYDQELGVSDPLRSKVRSAVARARHGSPEANEATQAMLIIGDQRFSQLSVCLKAAPVFLLSTDTALALVTDQIRKILAADELKLVPKK